MAKKKLQDIAPDDADEQLPRVKSPTPEEQKEIDKEQKKRAKKHKSVIADQEAIREGKYATGTAFMRANAVIKESESIPMNVLNTRQKARYADALAAVGKFDKAYELSKNEKYLEIWEAVWTEPEPCDCKDFSTTLLKDDKPVVETYSRVFTKQTVFSAKLGRWAALQCCNHCGHLMVME